MNWEDQNEPQLCKILCKYLVKIAKITADWRKIGIQLIGPTFEQGQCLQLNILRVAVSRRALRLLGFFLQRPLGERVNSVHKSSRRHFGNIKVSQMTIGRRRSMRKLFCFKQSHDLAQSTKRTRTFRRMHNIIA